MAKKEADWYKTYKTTKEIPVSKRIIDQVVGQDEAVKIIKKAAQQRRHVLLIGEPGTGKSMLGLALAEMLPKEKLVDVISFYNPNDENQPLIRTVPAGQGRDLAARARLQAMNTMKNLNLLFMILPIAGFFLSWYSWRRNLFGLGETANAIIFSSSLIVTLIIIALLIISMRMGMKMEGRANAPRVIVDNYKKKQVPFMDATGAHAGALLGDVLHDPFQSGGLGTPAHERVVAGMIHKANMGVLFIDEIMTLQPHTQQELLTAVQEGRYSITGQSERSAGAMVRTEPVPCNFILIAAGNLDGVKNMHPALRSRIRGYGYEIYMRESVEDNQENRKKFALFVAQEVRKDKRIPDFNREAVDQVLNEARRMANRKDHLTLYLRELGGLIRAAGDIATEEGASFVTKDHVMKAKGLARGLEKQIADRFIERKKEYEVIITKGHKIGRINGLAVIGGGSSLSGIILPIEAEVTPGGKSSEFIATGQLGEIAKEAVKNVSAIVKKYFGQDIKGTFDVYVQFLQTYEGVEGDSASIAVATTIISALKKVPIKQNYAVTGSLSVRGTVLPVGGVSAKVEAAIEAGVTHVIIPKSNLQDIVIDQERLKKVKLVPVSTLSEVLEEIMDWHGKQQILTQIKESKS